MSSRSKKSKASHRPKAAVSAGQPGPGVAGNRRRLWRLRLLAMILVPLLVLAGWEGILRLIGYGYDPGFFQPRRIGGENFLVENDKFGLRFFPPELVRIPEAIRLPFPKPPGTCRIFLFGESAAMGDPDPASGAGRYLETLLRERYPQQRFEVVNVAMTAINSHAILPIARDCAKLEGDFWIIYMGNNEMVGPFGAATVFGATAPPLWLARLSLSLQRLRLGQLLSAALRPVRGRAAVPSSWEGMQMFLNQQLPPDDPRRQAVYRSFRRNLEDILRLGLNSGARVLLNTMAVNLRDCPPFASLPGGNLPAAERVAFDSLYAQGRSFEQQGNRAAATNAYAQAAKLDPKLAELQFHWGETLVGLGQVEAAREHFQLACDFDALPFRAVSPLNRLIREAAQRSSRSNLVLVDAAAALNQTGAAGVSGQESFYEHAHFNFAGNYRLARLWAEEIARRLPPPLTARAAAEWASPEACERRLALTDWNRCNVLDEVILRRSRPPLDQQPDNGLRIAALRTWKDSLRQRMDAAGAIAAREIYLHALNRAPNDYYLHESFSDFLFALGDLKGACDQWRQVNDLIPHYYLPYYGMGRLLAAQGDFAQARASLTEAVRLAPGFSDGWLDLGRVCALAGNLEPALAAYGRARKLQPRDGRVFYYLAQAHAKLTHPAETILNYREAIRLKPDYWEAHFELAAYLRATGDLPEAIAEYRKAVQLRPDYAAGRLNLALALLKQGQVDEARQQLQETLRLEPGNSVAADGLAQLQAARAGQP